MSGPWTNNQRKVRNEASGTNFSGGGSKLLEYDLRVYFSDTFEHSKSLGKLSMSQLSQ